MEKFEKFTKGLSRDFEWVGVIGILAMFAANLVDVIGAKVFKWPLPGALEILSFALVVAIAPAIAYGLFLGTHLRIDFIVDKFPKTLRFVLGPFVSIMCMVLFVLISWKGFRIRIFPSKGRGEGRFIKDPLLSFCLPSYHKLHTRYPVLCS